MKFRLVAVAAATVALAACGSSDDASTEVEADTVEITADEAMEPVAADPVADPAATTVSAQPTAAAPAAEATEAAAVEEAGDNAAATAEAAMDAMAEN